MNWKGSKTLCLICTTVRRSMNEEPVSMNLKSANIPRIPLWLWSILDSHSIIASHQVGTLYEPTILTFLSPIEARTVEIVRCRSGGRQFHDHVRKTPFNLLGCSRALTTPGCVTDVGVTGAYPPIHILNDGQYGERSAPQPRKMSQ